jgi:hypothetical protein
VAAEGPETMPLTWEKRKNRLNDPHLDKSSFGPSPILCSDPDYASEQLERTTGFEPATLTLAKWGGVLVLNADWL